MGMRCLLFLTFDLASEWKKYASAAFFALPIGYTFHLGNWQRERYTWKVRPAIQARSISSTLPNFPTVSYTSPRL